MLQYKYRWLYAGSIAILIVTLGIFNFIFPAIKQLSQLEKIERQLTKTLVAKQHVLHPRLTKKMRVSIKKEQDLLADFYGLMQKQGLNMIHSEFKILPLGMLVQVTLETTYSRWLMLMFALTENMLLADFSYQISQQEVGLLTMDVLLLGTPSISKIEHQTFTAIENPMCKIDFIWPNDANALSELFDFPLAEIHVRGFLRQGERQVALVLLPNHNFVAVGAGDLIGKEKALVLTINKNEVRVQLPNQHQFVLQ